MSHLRPEEHFGKGLEALAQRKPREAALHFKGAMNCERELGIQRPQMRYLSYYGLSMAAAHKPNRQAIACCERAAAKDADPELLLNLGRVYYLAGLHLRALSALDRGLRLDPEHRGLRVMKSRVDRRARPLLPLLSRDHLLNRSLGRLRAALFPRRRSVGADRGSSAA